MSAARQIAPAPARTDWATFRPSGWPRCHTHREDSPCLTRGHYVFSSRLNRWVCRACESGETPCLRCGGTGVAWAEGRPLCRWCGWQVRWVTSVEREGE